MKSFLSDIIPGDSHNLTSCHVQSNTEQNMVECGMESVNFKDPSLRLNWFNDLIVCLKGSRLEPTWFVKSCKRPRSVIPCSVSLFNLHQGSLECRHSCRMWKCFCADSSWAFQVRTEHKNNRKPCWSEKRWSLHLRKRKKRMKQGESDHKEIQRLSNLEVLQISSYKQCSLYNSLLSFSTKCSGNLLDIHFQGLQNRVL